MNSTNMNEIATMNDKLLVDYTTFKNAQLRNCVESILQHGESMRASSLAICQDMALIKSGEYWKEDFNSFEDFAMKTFGLKRAQSYKLARIGATVVEKSGKSVYAIEDRDFTPSQLEFMVPSEKDGYTVKDVERLVKSGKLQPDMTRNEVRDVVAKELKKQQPVEKKETQVVAKKEDRATLMADLKEHLKKRDDKIGLSILAKLQKTF